MYHRRYHQKIIVRLLQNEQRCIPEVNKNIKKSEVSYLQLLLSELHWIYTGSTTARRSSGVRSMRRVRTHVHMNSVLSRGSVTPLGLRPPTTHVVD